MRGKARLRRRSRGGVGITPAYAGKSQNFSRKLYLCFGITPAYAGKSRTLWISDRSQEDHPRLCGEKHMEVYAICDITGSPPPMRGKVFLAPLVLSVYRITPAYAGKSWNSGVGLFDIEDHPRLCGEKVKFTKK